MRRVLDFRWRHLSYIEEYVIKPSGGMATARGTGGTFFQDYLATTTKYYFFPELFEFRNDLTVSAGGEVMEKD